MAGFELYRYSLPLVAPLKLAGATLHRREGLLLRLAGGDGNEGWGEAAPLPGFSRENVGEAEAGLRLLAKSVVGREVDAPMLADNATEAGPSALFGFETALWNLHAAKSGITLAEALSGVSGRSAATVPLSGLLSGTVGEVLGEARRMRAAGYRAVKLKVGGRSVGEDVDLVLALRSELGGAVELRLDANRAWSFEAAVGVARGVAGAGVAYIEEPLAEPGRLAEFVRECGVKIALDESLVGMAPEDLEDHRYARAVVLKPTLLGGISHVLRLARKARDLGMTPVVSSAYEGGVGMAALISVAAAIAPEPAPAGLDTYRRLASDTIHPRLDLSSPTINLRDLATLHVVRESWSPLP